MKIQDVTLWQLIDVLGNQPSFTLSNIRQALSIEFTERQRTGNFSSYEGGPMLLSDQTIIETIELRVRHKDSASRLLVLDFTPDSPCVTLAGVHTHYPESVVIGHPRGHSLEEKPLGAFSSLGGDYPSGSKSATLSV